MIKIRTANNDSDREAAYTLRYEHFYKEGTDPCYVLHEKKQYKDDFDTEKAKIIIAEDAEKRVVGTVRLLLKKETSLPYEWCYDYSYIAEYLAISAEYIYPRCALLDRGCVHPEYRGLGLYWKMVDYLESLMKENNADILLGTWIQADYQLALSHVRKSDWVLPNKKYINSKERVYYFGFKLL